MDKTTGCIQVAGQLDRETTETVTMTTIVVDLNAVSDGKLQTATGK